MEQKDFLQIKNAIDKAEEDTKPIAGIVDDKVVVKGDVNDTKIEPKDYTAHFVIPEHIAKNIDSAKLRSDGYAELDIEYKNVFPTARDNVKFTSAISQLLPFYRSMDEHGGIDDMSEEDFINHVLPELKDDIVDAIYRVVKVVLGIDETLIGWLTPGSALMLVSQILHDFPSVVNQADLFFASSTEKA